MNLRIEVPREQIVAFCERWRIAEFAFFGSVLRDDFGPGSDIDVLVRFHPDSHHRLSDMLRMQDELSGILGRRTDMVSHRAVEESRNYILRKKILQSAEVFYAA